MLLIRQILVPGHGTAMEGDELRNGLKELVERFDDLAVPDHGRYVEDRE